ncbi:MAG: fumarylacetoacetate hydrolase family protein [Clostridia bacterium]
MKFVTFTMDNVSKIGVMLDDDINVFTIDNVPEYQDCKTMVELIAKMGTSGFRPLKFAILGAPDVKTYKLADLTLESPIPRPIHDVMCVGVNYNAHFEECQAEMPMEKPESAVYFSKRSSCILGATADIPHIAPCDDELDYEVELAVIIGEKCKDVKACDAEKYIFGYSIFNDLSARSLQKAHKQWYKGKGLDNTSVMGPYIVSKNEVAYPPQIDISCSVNGEIRQNSNTRMLIHDISSMIEDLSAGCTLEPGDILITGTPAGVGMGFNPPQYLKVGDIVECKIEKLGAHCNKIV